VCVLSNGQCRPLSRGRDLEASSTTRRAKLVAGLKPVQRISSAIVAPLVRGHSWQRPRQLLNPYGWRHPVPGPYLSRINTTALLAHTNIFIDNNCLTFFDFVYWTMNTHQYAVLLLLQAGLLRGLSLLDLAQAPNSCHFSAHVRALLLKWTRCLPINVSF